MPSSHALHWRLPHAFPGSLRIARLLAHSPHACANFRPWCLITFYRWRVMQRGNDVATDAASFGMPPSNTGVAQEVIRQWPKDARRTASLPLLLLPWARGKQRGDRAGDTGCQMIHDMRPSAETRGHLAPRPSPQTLRLPLLISSSAPCSAPHLHRACNYENSHA